MLSKLFSVLVVVSTLGGCALGAMTAPVMKEIKTTPSRYDANFSAIIRTINSNGTVTGSDKAEGYINGNMTNIKISALLSKAGGVKVTGTLPGDRFLVGTTLDSELNKFMSALQPELK